MDRVGQSVDRTKLVLHSSNLAFMEERQEESHPQKVSLAVCPKSHRGQQHLEYGALTCNTLRVT